VELYFVVEEGEGEMGQKVWWMLDKAEWGKAVSVVGDSVLFWKGMQLKEVQLEWKAGGISGN
jgi:hypothetical protein